MRQPALARFAAIAAALIFAGCAGGPGALPQASATPAGPTATRADTDPTAILRATPAPAVPAATQAPAPSPVPSPGAGYPAPGAATQAPAASPYPAGQIAPSATPPPSAAAPAPTAPAPAAPAAAPAPTAPAPAAAPPVLGYRVVRAYPHDQGAFTQGLVYVGDDTFYEGTGLVGRSTLREVGLDGTVRRTVAIDPAQFGEGVAVVGERIFQLTWQNCVGYIYDRASFQQVGTFAMPADTDGACLEGWGLTYDGSRLILSDGSSRLFFVDPDATARSGQLAVTGQVNVADAAGPVLNLNELEYIDGQVFANIWQTERIARIDPATGAVTAYIDLAGLRSQTTPNPALPGPEVLNGIAYDAANGRLFVTGKLWPQLFEITLVGEAAHTVFLPLAEQA
jgi:glutamine cyclotransferase